MHKQDLGGKLLTVSGTTKRAIIFTSIPKFDEAAKQIKVGAKTFSPSSDQYSVRMKISGTTVWYPVFTNITRPMVDDKPAANQKVTGSSWGNYYTHVHGWSHSFSTVELGTGTSIDVEVTLLNDNEITNGNTIILPASKTKYKNLQVDKVQGVITFTIAKTGQYYLDINSQMTDTKTGSGYSDKDMQCLSIFVNPIIANKPILDAGVAPNTLKKGVFYIDPSKKHDGLSLPSGTKTVYFRPGIHTVGRNFRIASNVNYYIPGDAIVYGTFNAPKDGTTVANVKFYGSGIISGDKIAHPKSDPDHKTDKIVDHWKSIYLPKCDNIEIYGVTFTNSAYHTVNLNVFKPSPAKNHTNINHCKVINWRGNGDGFGNAHSIADCFIRVQDDGTYFKGDRTRCIFWNDVNGGAFVLAGIPPVTEMEEISITNNDVLFMRCWNDKWEGGNVFRRTAGQADQIKGRTEPIKVNVVVDGLRITDKHQSGGTIKVRSHGVERTEQPEGSGKFINLPHTTCGYTGLKFKNITAVKGLPKDGESKELHGNFIEGFDDTATRKEPASKWGVCFSNVKFGGVLVDNVSKFGILKGTTMDFGCTTTSTTSRFKPSDKATEDDLESGMIVFYNDNSNVLKVNSGNESISSIELYDMNSSLKFKSDVNAKSSENVLPKLATGVYLVRINTATSATTKKIIIK